MIKTVLGATPFHKAKTFVFLDHSSGLAIVMAIPIMIYNVPAMKNAALFAVSFLALCQLSPATTPAQYAAQASSADDPYEKISLIASPLFVVTRDGARESVKARFVADKKSKETTLVVMYHDNGWIFLNDAFDSEGTHLATHVIKREVFVADVVDEQVSIALPPNYLKKHSQSGLDIKVDGKNSAIIVKLPPAYVEGFLLALK
jgi:hypothetical protein